MQEILDEMAKQFDELYRQAQELIDKLNKEKKGDEE